MKQKKTEVVTDKEMRRKASDQKWFKVNNEKGDTGNISVLRV